jgi:hypothetical protein
MDILIDLIIYLIKQASRPRQGPAAPSSQQKSAAHAQRLAAMNEAVSIQQKRTQPRQTGKAPVRPPPLVRPPASWTQPGVQGVTPPVKQPPVPVIARDSIPPVRRRSTRIPAMQLPFLLGEVLDPPLALRDD